MVEGGDASRSNPPPISSTRIAIGEVEEDDVIVCSGSGGAAEAEDAWVVHTAAADVRAATLPPALRRKDRLGVGNDDDDKDAACGDEIERAWQWQRLLLTLARSLFAVRRTDDDNQKKAAARRRRFPMLLILRQCALAGRLLAAYIALVSSRPVSEKNDEASCEVDHAGCFWSVPPSDF